MVRTNKQINLDFPNVTSCIGTVNKLDPKVVYLSCKWWIRSPKAYGEDFLGKFLDRIKKSLERKIKEVPHFSNSIIFIPIDYLTPLAANDSKYMSFDIYLRQLGEINKIEMLKEELCELMRKIIDEFTADYQSYAIQISKKRVKG